jgi:hypothetical protein
LHAHHESKYSSHSIHTKMKRKLFTVTRYSGFHALLIGCLVLLNASLKAQNFVYAKGMSNSAPLGGYMASNSIRADNLGNVFVIGYFEATADFDPGPGIANLTSAGGKDIFIARYTAAGNYVYAKAIGGSSQESTPGDNGQSITIDGAGNVYITGSFMGTADFDPGPGVANLVSEGGGDIFIAKYDATGHYVYAKSMGGISDDIGQGIAVDGSGNVYVIGGYYGTVDFDPGGGVANLNTGGMFIAKYDALGNYLYAKGMEGQCSGKSIAVDGAGNAFITGSYGGTIDFDPGAGVHELTCLGTGDLFVARYDVSGNYVYAKRMGGIASPGDGYEAVGNSITVDGSGNTYITGQYSGIIDFDPGAGEANLTGAGYWDIFIARYDGSGNYVYARPIGNESYDVGNGIQVDGLGSIVITGSFTGMVDFDPGPGTANLISGPSSTDIFVARYDAAGNYLYARAMTSATQSGAGFGLGVATDGPGNTYITGYFGSTVDFDPGPGIANLTVEDGINAFVTRLSNAGNYDWAKQLGSYSREFLFDEGKSIAVDGLGNTYVTGYFSGTVDFDPGAGIANLSSAGAEDIFIARYDASGNYIYAKRMGGPEQDEGYGIGIDASGNIYITGSFKQTVDFDPGASLANLTSQGSWEIFLAKFDASGNYIYAKSMGGAGEDIALGISVDGPGNAYITGYFTGMADFDPGNSTANLTSAGASDIFIGKYDPSGNYLYAKRMGGTNYSFGESITADISGNVFITGTFYGTADFDPGAGVVNLATAGEGDVFIAKYSATGNYVYAKAISGNSYQVGRDIGVDATGNVYVTGRSVGIADFDPGFGIMNMTSLGESDCYLAKYDVFGNYIYAKRIGGYGYDNGESLFIDGTGNAYITGAFSQTVDFDPGDGIANLSSTAQPDIFLAKYDPSGNYVYAKGTSGFGFSGNQGNGITVDGSGNIYVTGSFINTVDFDPGVASSNSTLKALNLIDIFIAKYGPPGTVPITLLSFDAKANNKADAVLVSWRTASEINNAYFEVERSSNGVLFEKIGRVKGCGTCNATQEYNFTDNEPYNGVSYYRLKQVDNNNKFSYSRIVSVEISNKSNTILQVNPNITDGAFKLIVKETADDKRAKVQIYNQAGSLVKQQAINLHKGDNVFDMNLSDQSRGVYYIGITDEKGGKIATGRVMRK